MLKISFSDYVELKQNKYYASYIWYVFKLAFWSLFVCVEDQVEWYASWKPETIYCSLYAHGSRDCNSAPRN